MYGTSYLGYVLLGLSWVALFVLLCDKKVAWVCHNKAGIPLQLKEGKWYGTWRSASCHLSLYILLAVVEYLLSIATVNPILTGEKGGGGGAKCPPSGVFYQISLK